MSQAKPYSLQKLAEKLKKKGLPLAEEGAETVYESVKEWAVESALESEPKWDDSLAIAFPLLDKVVQPQLDKIDGQEG